MSGLLPHRTNIMAQPHGVLVVTDKHFTRITHVADSLLPLLSISPEMFVDAPVERLFGEETAHDIRNALGFRDIDVNPAILEGLVIQETSVDISISRGATGAVIEIFFEDPTNAPLSHQAFLRMAAAPLPLGGFNQIVDALLSGFLLVTRKGHSLLLSTDPTSAHKTDSGPHALSDTQQAELISVVMALPPHPSFLAIADAGAESVPLWAGNARPPEEPVGTVLRVFGPKLLNILRGAQMTSAVILPIALSGGHTLLFLAGDQRQSRLSGKSILQIRAYASYMAAVIEAAQLKEQVTTRRSDHG